MNKWKKVTMAHANKKSRAHFCLLIILKHIFGHFGIHRQFEHNPPYARVNGSSSEEPDSALSGELTVHQRTGKLGCNL